MLLNKSLEKDFKGDCNKLITHFCNADDIRFQSFIEIWKDLKFSLIFTSQQTVLTLSQFCIEAVYISKQFLLSSTQFKERIGGLYLLYGIYYKMPCAPFKIKVNLSDWQSIVELHNQISEGEHLDANYILSKMIADNIFHYYIFEQDFGLEKHFRVKKRQSINPYSILPSIRNMNEQTQILSTIHTLSKCYQQKKCDVLGSKNGTPSLNLYDANIVKKVMDEIWNLERQKQNQSKEEFLNKYFSNEMVKDFL